MKTYASHSNRFLILVMMLMLWSGARAAEGGAPAGALQAREARVSRELTYRYWQYLPADYASSTERHPLILFLHGGGESGDDLERVKKHGLPKELLSGRTLPCIVLAPQNPDSQKLWDDRALMRFLEDRIRELRVDESRIYLAGLSRGGHGVYRLAVQNPKRFAAVAMMCGGGPVTYATWCKDIPFWLFHGDRDTTVPTDESRRLAAALRNAGGEARLTIYPDTDHDCWTRAFADDALYAWLLAQRLSSPARPEGIGAGPAMRAPVPEPGERTRVVVLTDIANEPDDEESMVRFLVSANEYDVEALIASTSTYLRSTTRVDLIHRQIGAYEQVRSNLVRHAPGYPTAEHLRAITAVGQPGYGLAATGEGRSTAGSRLLLAATDRPDDRPLWVTVWGGANTLAQALIDARRERSAADLTRIINKLRVYSISDQDDSGPWLRREFPGLFWIVSPSTTDWREYHRATWTGISGDRHYQNGPGHVFHLVDNPWLEANVIQGHGPLGALYPKLAYIMEGDTPSFLGLVNNGLGWHLSPAHGGWGGRYVLYQAHGESRPIWTNNQDSRDTVTASNGQTVTSDPATIWRWREAFQHEFAARMDWCVAAEYGLANHPPVAVLNGDRTRRVLELTARPGETLTLSAAGSGDPDGHALTVRWWVYREAGSYKGEVALSSGRGVTTALRAPEVREPATVHVILEVTDSGTPALTAYRRTILTVAP